MILPIWDRALPTVVASIDATLRRFGGVPTYGLTDNERTVTIDHVAGISIRNRDMVAAAHHYGLTVVTCMVADPEAKGGSEATVRIAKADLVPTEANLLAEYPSFRALEAACADVCETFNGRPHRVTRRPPVEMLVEERARLHRLPDQPYTLAFGESRTVGRTTPMVDHDWCQYSAPHELRGEEVWVREHGEDIVIVHVGAGGPVEVARHQRTTPGTPRVNPDHFPPQPAGPLNRIPVATTAEEADFLGIGMGAQLWLREAGRAGAVRVRAKMGHAVALSKLVGAESVNWALGHAAVTERFDDGDLESIVNHREATRSTECRSAGDSRSLQAGTAAWEGFGQ